MNDATGPERMQTHNPSLDTLGNTLRPESSVFNESQPSSVTDILPYEILVAVIKELDWLDVLRARTVSRLILAASRERSVWETICKRHETQRLPNSHFLEKKTAICTASELEAAFLRPRKSNAAWGSSTRLSHRLFHPPDGCTPLLLLPGGRWVIATTEPHRHVVCCDLDAHKAPGEKNDQFVLAENPFPLDARPRTVIHLPKVVIDTAHVSSPYLTFNFAVYFNAWHRDHLDRDLPGYKFIQVWHVEPVYDASGCIVGLGSTLLSSFEIEASGLASVDNFALFGAYLSYRVPLSDFICVVEWRGASGRDFERWRMRPGVTCCIRVYFLSDDSDLILHWGSGGVALCNFKAASPTKEHDSDCYIGRQHPVWSHQEVDPRKSIGAPVGPFQTIDGLTFMMCGREGTTVSSLIIPSNLSDPMTTVPCLEHCSIDESQAHLNWQEPRGLQRRDATGFSKIVQVIKYDNDNVSLRHAYLPWERQKVYGPVRYSHTVMPSGLHRSWQSLDEVSSRILAGDQVTWVYAAWVVFDILGDSESPQPQ